MKKFFNGIRWLAVAVLVIPTLIIIVGGGVLISVSETATNPENPKAWLNEGKVYKNAVEIGVGEVIKRARDSAEDETSVEEMTRGLADEQKINEIANNVFPPEWIKIQTENIIDSSYAFLEGKTENLSFSIDLTEVNQNAKQGLSALFIEKAQSLPKCSEDTNTAIEDINLLEADCFPPNIEIFQIETLIESEVDSVSFFQNNTINSEDLDLQIEEADNIQKIYSALEGAPLIILFASLLFTFVIILFAPKLKSKLKTFGYLWGMGGLFIATIALVIKASLSSFFVDLVLDNLPQENTAVINFVKSPLELAVADITNYMLVLGGIVLTTGIIIGLSSRLVKK